MDYPASIRDDLDSSVAQCWRRWFDGEIKAPPSVGVHVVGLIDVFATAQKLTCWRLGQ